MTREEQIVEAAKAKEKETGFCELVKNPVSRGVNSAYGIGFLEGAAIGRREMLDKVCKWLEENMEDYTEWFDYDEGECQHHAISSGYDYKKDFIEALRKVMEEQQ